MLAMTYQGPYRIQARQKPEPTIEHPNDAIIRVTRAAICGSDLHLYHGFVPDTRVGTTFGHEFTGVVEEVGSSVQNLAKGDRVVVPFNISCGTCFYCSRRLYADCENTNPAANFAAGVYGYSHSTGGYDGGQAELVRVPFSDIGPMKIPDSMDDEEVLFLSDILPTGYQAAEMGDIRPGDAVVVFGCGPVGLFAQKSAWLMGASRVIAVDHLDYRLEFARKYNNVETVNFTQVDDIVLTLLQMTDKRGADVCIDAVGLEADGNFLQTLTGIHLKVQAGAATATAWSIHSVRKAGRVSVIGVYGPPWNLIPFGTAMNKGVTLRMGQANCKRYMPHLLEHIKSGVIDAKAIITHRLPLEEVAEGYDLFSSKRDNCIKTILIPPSAAKAA